MANDKLQELRRYCVASANFITDDDSEQDRFARMAYRDVISKIDDIESEGKEVDAGENTLPIQRVMPRFSDDEEEEEELEEQEPDYYTCMCCGNVQEKGMSCNKCAGPTTESFY